MSTDQQAPGLGAPTGPPADVPPPPPVQAARRGRRVPLLLVVALGTTLLLVMGYFLGLLDGQDVPAVADGPVPVADDEDGSGEGSSEDAADGASSEADGTGSGGDEDVADTEEPAGTDEAGSGAASPGTEASGEEGEGEEASAEGDDGDATTASNGAEDADAGVIPDVSDAPRRATYSGGTLELEGAVPSQEVADELAGKAALIVGRENVVVDFEIDPDAPLQAPQPIFIEDLVLFRYGSAEIQSDFEPILDLGVDLLTRVPSSTLTIVGHTDGAGPADENLELSQERVDAVVDYLVDNGADPDRLTGVARGEQDLIPGAGPATNRRTEFFVNNVLGS